MGAVRQGVLVVLCFAATLELATRVDQSLSYGAPVWGRYTYDSVLYMEDEYGIKGRPNASYEKWQLNSLGFRGPETSLTKVAGVTRIACFGASETFGLYESLGKEWPRQLEQVLDDATGPVEVLNVALAGMSLYQRVVHFEHRIIKFQPDLAILMLEFPSYAGLTAEKIAKRNAGRLKGSAEHPVRLQDLMQSIRFLAKLKQSVLPKLPRNLQDSIRDIDLRLKLKDIESRLGGEFRSLRELKSEEIEAFETDLKQFLDIADRHGVSVLVVSPAMWVSDDKLQTFYSSWPYIDEAWITAARRQLPEVARRIVAGRGGGFVDLAAVVQGHESDLMKDEVHFSDQGAQVVAHALADVIVSCGSSRRDGSRVWGNSLCVTGSTRKSNSPG